MHTLVEAWPGGWSAPAFFDFLFDFFVFAASNDDTQYGGEPFLLQKQSRA
jgi:hypothetical protein